MLMGVTALLVVEAGSNVWPRPSACSGFPKRACANN